MIFLKKLPMNGGNLRFNQQMKCLVFRWNRKLQYSTFQTRCNSGNSTLSSKNKINSIWGLSFCYVFLIKRGTKQLRRTIKCKMVFTHRYMGEQGSNWAWDSAHRKWQYNSRGFLDVNKTACWLTGKLRFSSHWSLVLKVNTAFTDASCRLSILKKMSFLTHITKQKFSEFF